MINDTTVYSRANLNEAARDIVTFSSVVAPHQDGILKTFSHLKYCQVMITSKIRGLYTVRDGYHNFVTIYF